MMHHLRQTRAQLLLFPLLAAAALLFLLPLTTRSQDLPSGLRVWGNFRLDAQYYLSDSLIGAPEVPEHTGLNAWASFNMSYQGLSMGFRYESYLPPLQGYDRDYRGHGLAYRYASYSRDNFEITAGNFYEQFGSGLILRAYEEQDLGIDNSIDGVRVLLRPHRGISLKALAGQQRHYWDRGQGIVRGVDAGFSLNELFPSMAENMSRWSLGTGLVSKFQEDRNPLLNLPENVAALASRLGYSRGALNLSAEYAHKVNDPSADNGFIYKNGQALLLTGSWSVQGIGLLLSAKHIDNMGFRSDRNASGNNLHINYLPPTTRQHLYSLSGMYPYATQVNGEIGLMGELTFRLARDSRLGGPFGTTVGLYYSQANAIKRDLLYNPETETAFGTDGYRANLFQMGDELYFRDFHVEVNRRFSRNFRAMFSYVFITYNQNVIEGYLDKEMVYAHTAIADMSLRLPGRRSLRWEVQHLATRQDKGNWAMLLAEYSIAPSWFFSVSDQYNYGNDDPGQRIHYYSLSAGYNQGASRLSLAWGRQREGIVCIGGVCRMVPAANGLTLNLSSSF